MPMEPRAAQLFGVPCGSIRRPGSPGPQLWALCSAPLHGSLLAVPLPLTTGEEFLGACVPPSRVTGTPKFPPQKTTPNQLLEYHMLFCILSFHFIEHT